MKESQEKCSLPCDIQGCNYVALDVIEYSNHFIDNHHAFQTDKINYIIYSNLRESHLSNQHLLNSLA